MALIPILYEDALMVQEIKNVDAKRLAAGYRQERQVRLREASRREEIRN